MATKTAKKSTGSSSRSGNSRSGSSRGNGGPTSRSGNSGRSNSGPSSSSRSKGGSSRSKSGGEPGSLMQKFFLDELKDIYWAEKALMKALKKMSKEATTEELKEAFMTHMQQTEGQITRLEQVFEILGARAQGKKCEAMSGLIEEAESVIEDTQDDTLTRDVALIISAQKAEHYEIAAYGGLSTLAKTMGQSEIAELLVQTLEEEKETDALLTSIAENNINMEATQEGGEEEEE
ncbi:MAG: ferritin-like protein [Chitinophagaceae bacterium]|nr:ferritin-like protein [Chitinophagaceae bacterium]